MSSIANPLAAAAGLVDATGSDGLPLKPEGALGTNQELAEGQQADLELGNTPLTTDANITAGLTSEEGPEAQRNADGVNDNSPSAGETPINAAVNADGFRNKVMNPNGYITTLDDDTARVFKENPNFYAYVYDEHERKSVMVHTMRWVDEHGFPLNDGVLGQRY